MPPRMANRRKWRHLRVATWVMALLAVIAVACFVFHVGVRCETLYIDPVTGSTRVVISWGVPLVKRSTERTTAIHDWLVRREGKYTPRWEFVSQTGRSMDGQIIFRGIGDVSVKHLHGQYANVFVKCSSDAEVAWFVQVMREGEHANQREMVVIAWERAMDVIGHPLVSETHDGKNVVKWGSSGDSAVGGAEGNSASNPTRQAGVSTDDRSALP